MGQDGCGDAPGYCLETSKKAVVAVYLAYPCKAPAACLGLPLRSPKGGEGQAYRLASPKIQLILLHQRNQHLSKSSILGWRLRPQGRFQAAIVGPSMLRLQ